MKEKKKKVVIGSVKSLLLTIAVIMVVFNQLTISALHQGHQRMVSATVTEDTETSGMNRILFSYTETGDPVQDAIDSVFLTGTPVWSDGSVNYDNIEESLEILATIDRVIPVESLPEELKERYIAIGTTISCEYCCGALAIIFPDGRAACGCAHSFALRGLAKFLLTQYGDSYINEEILFEMTAWKNLFFPKNTVEKAASLIANGMDITPTALNDHKLLARIETGDVGSIGQLQGMVGGC